MTLSKTTFRDLLFDAFRANTIISEAESFCTDGIADQFFSLTEELLRVNAMMNLTAITDPGEIIVKHYADCAAGTHLIPMGADMADIGTGAGFPSLPFAILRPDITVTAVDSTKKKLDYVQGCAKLLGLSNLTVLPARAEQLGQMPEYREAFDFVSARAVARLNVLSEWCLPLVKKGGYFLAMKGRGAEDELSEAGHAIDTLGGISEKAELFSLVYPASIAEAENTVPESMARGLILVKKRQFTPKQYPRPNTQISKKPL